MCKISDLVIFGWGNEARGDDAIGPLLAEQVEKRWPGVAVVTDDQLQLEHALDLKGRKMALFIDAGHGTEPPFTFREVEPVSGLTHTSHALPPESVLHVYSHFGDEAPSAFVLCVAGQSFELGESIRPETAGNIATASSFIDHLLSNPEPYFWREHITA